MEKKIKSLNIAVEKDATPKVSRLFLTDDSIVGKSHIRMSELIQFVGLPVIAKINENGKPISAGFGKGAHLESIRGIRMTLEKLRLYGGAFHFCS